VCRVDSFCVPRRLFVVSRVVIASRLPGIMAPYLTHYRPFHVIAGSQVRTLRGIHGVYGFVCLYIYVTLFFYMYATFDMYVTHFYISHFIYHILYNYVTFYICHIFIYATYISLLYATLPHYRQCTVCGLHSSPVYRCMYTFN
jgi:hypothetical protein